MQILTVDVGTGTQDVLLFDSERELENCFKLVLPSPTVINADRIRLATAARGRLVLQGVTMGGGPSHWATMDHVRAGLEAFATPEAARTFDDDLDAVASMGIQVVSDDEAVRLADGGAVRVFMRDLALGLFEHHTGELSPEGLGTYVRQLSEGTITNEAVFASKGHGALVFRADAPPPDLLAVTGPRRALLVESGLQPYLAVPHGDMMLAG